MHGDSSVFLIGFGICSSGFGDALYERRTYGYLDGLTIAMIIISCMILFVGCLLYALNKGVEGGAGSGFGIVYLIAASLVSFTTTVVAAR
jgi:hypothetical protein